MAAARRCSECGGSLAHRGAKALTCCAGCRTARKRRLDRQEAREQAERNLPDEVRRMKEQVRAESPGIVDKTLREELRPIVREAITEDTIRAINQLVQLAPRAVELIAADMEDPDALVRQRAYTLMMKYTVGHPALVAHEDTAAGSQINVRFELPRPDTDSIEAAVIEEAPPEDRECDICHESKPVTDFVANSSRCQACFDSWKQAILQDYAERA